MEAKQMVCATAHPETGTICVAGLRNASIHVIGASVPMSAKPGDTVSSFYLSPITGRKGVVAISAHRSEGGKHGRYEVGSFLLFVGFIEGEPFINLETEWVPLVGRLGQVTSSEVSVDILGKRFSTKEPFHVDTDPKPASYVVDANLLCKYLAGDIDAGDVWDALQQKSEEVVARERLPLVESELERARQEIQQLRVLVNKEQTARQELAVTHLEAVCNLEGLHRRYKSMKTLARIVVDFAQNRRFKGTAVTMAINEFIGLDAADARRAEREADRRFAERRIATEA